MKRLIEGVNGRTRHDPWIGAMGWGLSCLYLKTSVADPDTFYMVRTDQDQISLINADFSSFLVSTDVMNV